MSKHAVSIPLSRQQVIDQYFMEHRAKLIDIAAFLDRVERAEGEDEFRVAALREAMQLLTDGKPQRAKRVLEALSDPSDEPIDKAPGKGAVGAYENI